MAKAFATRWDKRSISVSACPIFRGKGGPVPKLRAPGLKVLLGVNCLELGQIGRPTEIRLTVTAFLAPHQRVDAQRIGVWANGVKLGEATLTAATAKEISFVIPSSVPLRDDRRLEIRFEYPDAAAPDTLGVSTDARLLAFYFHSLVLR